MDLKFHFMLMNDHFSIQILSEPSFNVFFQDRDRSQIIQHHSMQIRENSFMSPHEGSKKKKISV